MKDLNGEAYSPASLAKLAGLDPAKLPAVGGNPRLGAPVTGISKFVAIGLNYVDHAKETGNPIPPEPIFFLKANTALSGPNDAVEKPRGSMFVWAPVPEQYRAAGSLEFSKLLLEKAMVAVSPGIGFCVCLWIWLSVSPLAMKVGALWTLAGFAYLVILMRRHGTRLVASASAN